jgi:hypothetical protein
MPIITGKRPERPVDVEQFGLTNALWKMTTCCWHAEALRRPRLKEVKLVCNSEVRAPSRAHDN